MIPQEWKDKFRKSEKIFAITCEIFEKVKKNTKCCHYFYCKYVSNFWWTPEKQQTKWEKTFGSELINWKTIYKLPFICTFNNKFTIFQY